MYLYFFLKKAPCDQIDTYLHLASSVPLLSPVLVSVAPVYALCSGASRPFSPAASARAPREPEIQGTVRDMHVCVGKQTKRLP